MKSDNIQSHVIVIDMETKKGNIWFSQVGWITHVQFHPEDHNKILYNHEGGMVDQRIWLYDHGNTRKIRDQSVGLGSMWICHEMWTQQGNKIIYHGTTGVPNDPAMKELSKDNAEIVSFVGCFDSEHNEYHEVMFPEEMKVYGHFTANSNDGMLVTDGVIDAKSIHVLHPDWRAKQTS